MPINSVNAAPRKQNARESDSKPPGQASFLLIHGNTLFISPLPIVSIKRVNPSVRPIVSTTDIEELLASPIILKITEKMSHPIRSLIIADEITSIPILDRKI